MQRLLDGINKRNKRLAKKLETLKPKPIVPVEPITVKPDESKDEAGPKQNPEKPPGIP